MALQKGMTKTTSIGDAAVEGLIYGIVAGLGMALFVVALQWLAGVMPLEALGSFGATAEAPPWVGLFTHVAVSGIYGVLFGMLALAAARLFSGRINRGLVLLLGILYGFIIFAVAIGIILPRTASPLNELPTWALASAHVVYGFILAWFVGRKA